MARTLIRSRQEASSKQTVPSLSIRNFKLLRGPPMAAEYFNNPWSIILIINNNYIDYLRTAEQQTPFNLILLAHFGIQISSLISSNTNTIQRLRPICEQTIDRSKWRNPFARKYTKGYAPFIRVPTPGASIRSTPSCSRKSARERTTRQKAAK